MHSLKSFAFLALPLAIVASPVANYSPDPKISAIINSWECLAVDFVVKTLNAYPSATPFCSSFLAIPTITTTVTQTSTSVVPKLLTTFTSTATITSTAVVTATASTTVTACTTTSAPAFKARDALEDRGADNILCTTSTTLKKTTTTTTPCLTTTAKPHPTPTIPSCVSGYESAAISTACACLAIPTPTSTVYTTLVKTSTSTTYTSLVSTASTAVTATTTVTATSTAYSCPTPTSCANQGLQYAVYNNTSGPDYGGADKYPGFQAETYKTQAPVYTSTTNTVGLNVSDSGTIISIYNSPVEFQSEYFIVNHRGYLVAKVTGTYTFTATSVDDTVCLWLGTDAYSGWTRGNDNLDASYDNAPGQATITYNLTAGQYLPIRIIFAQAQGDATFGLTITAPDGSCPTLVQYSCDGKTAPAYATPFGAET